MNEKVRYQQYRFMLYNLIAFTLIFTLFGIILYSQIRALLFQPVEESLQNARDSIVYEPDWLDRQLYLQDALWFQRAPEILDSLTNEMEKRKGGEKPGGGQPEDGGPGGGQPDGGGPGGPGPEEEPRFEPRKMVPMHLQSILRSEEGEVLNPQLLGSLYYDGYLDEIPVAVEDELDKILFFSMLDASYSSLTFALTDSEGNTYHIQLLSNVDGEIAILNNFVHLLILCIIVFVSLSLVASYLLSKKTMAPILKSWNRQTEFVENASHELRTPLTIIQNKMESLLTHPQSTIMERAGEIGVTLGETRRLSKLTTDLMTLARADSNEVLLEKERFALDELIRQVAEPYGELAEMQHKELLLSLGFGRELFADRGRIHELMVILLDNALKYTGEGESIEIRTFLKDGRGIIEVRDTGIGISQDSLRRVFDRFYRADKARSRAMGGSGLGLSIAKWIVDAHGGSIQAQQNHPTGTVMQVRLKLP